MSNRRRSGMGRLAGEAARETNAALSDEEMSLFLTTTIDWNSLSPEITSNEEFEALKKEVQNATEHNENLAQLKSRFEALGKNGISLAKNILSKLP